MHLKVDYRSVPNDPEAVPQSFYDTKEEESKEWRPSTPHSTAARWHWIVHAGCLATSFGLILLLLYTHDSTRVAARCWSMYYYYSPVNTALEEYQYITTRFNGSLWHDTPFKGPPSPAVDEAWHSVMQYGMIAVSASDYQRVNHSTRTAVRFPDEAGRGYMVTTVGTYQLHCLHYIWQDHHREYYPDVMRKTKDVPELYERHYEHCVDYIRKNFRPSLVLADRRLSRVPRLRIAVFHGFHDKLSCPSGCFHSKPSGTSTARSLSHPCTTCQSTHLCMALELGVGFWCCST